jgi:GMP synthase (glutamine-hydrolysing)
MLQTTVIRHLAFEDLGSFEVHLPGVRYLDAGVHPLRPEGDLLVVMGGPIGVYEEDKYPVLREELTLLERWLGLGKPLLGICLGAQLIAKACGARVYPGGAKEIGWSPVRLTSAGMETPLRHLDGVPVLHWHGDTFVLPKGAELLASTDLYENQAFSYGPRVLAIQFHPEVRDTHIEQWLMGHACELASAGIDVPLLRNESHYQAPKLQPHAEALLKDWLASVR